MRSRGSLITPVLIGALLSSSLAVGLLAFSRVAKVQAHGLGQPWVQVPGGLVRPGEEFEVWGADFGPYATVDLVLSTGQETVAVGEVTAGGDGHFTTAVRAPDELPEGFAELNATTDDGLWSSVWVQVSTSGAVAQQAAWWMDPSVIVLGLFVVGAAALVGFVLLRGRRVAPPALAPAARRPLPSKKRRSRVG